MLHLRGACERSVMGYRAKVTKLTDFHLAARGPVLLPIENIGNVYLTYFSVVA